MFSMFQKKSKLDLEIDSVVSQLKHHAVDSEEYAKIVEILIQLNKVKSEQDSSVSRDTILVVAANLLGILMIIKHEHVNVITSRATNFLMKPR